MAHLRPIRALGTGALLVVAACGGDAPDRPELPPLAVSSDAPFCQSVAQAVNAYHAEQSAAHPRPDDPRYGGTVVVAGGGDFRGGLNALTTGDQTDQETELHLLHVTLTRFAADRTPEPYLAESWTLAEDGSGVTFRLRDDVTWHDGQPVTAEDVAFTYRRAMDPATGFPNAGWFQFYDADAVEVLDDHTVRFAFTPHAEVMDPFSNMAIMPRHLLADVPAAEMGGHPFGTECPVGAGPFVFEAYRPGDQWVLRANPAFPEALGGRPFLDRYVYRVIPSSSTRAGELAAGGVHVALGLEPVDAEAVASRDGVRLAAFDSRSFAFIGWNPRLPGLSDARVRTALTMALDREALLETLRGEYGTRVETGVPDFHWAYDADLPGPPHDPDGARTMLEEAGWTDRDGDGVRENPAGDELRFDLVTNSNTERETIARIMSDELGDVGVAFDLQVVDNPTFSARLGTPSNRDFGAFILGFAPDFNINERDFFHSSSDATGYGWSALDDPELDRLLDTLPRIRDRDQARPLWAEYQRRIVELQPYTYLFFSQRLNGLDRDLVGVEMDLRGELINVPAWYWNPETN